MTKQLIPNLLLKRVHLTPQRIAIQFEEKSYTFKDLYELARQEAGRLQAQGVKKGDFIALLLRNHPDTVVIMLSLQLIGAVAVVLNNRLTSEELKWQLNDSKAKLLVTEEGFHDKVQSFSIPTLTKEELRKLDAINAEVLQEIDLEDVCSIMYTSGTTGHPKGVLQTYGNHWWSSVGSALNLGLKEEDCWLCAVPLFHISGYSILIRSIVYGMKIVLHESFHEKKVIADIRKENVTIMSVVMTMLSRMVDALGEERLPQEFRCMLLGGGPAPLPLLEHCVEKEIPVYQTYGMTETSSQIVTLAPEYSMKKLGSAGKPLFPSQLKIVNELGAEVGPLETGEIIVKGPNITSGYLHRGHDSADFMDEGWFKTGDVGYLDEEGFLFVQDRRKDLIISGGENIYPAEIEGILLSHPQIHDAGVIGIKDDKWGQVPVAFVLKKGHVSEEEIIEYCSERLAKYKLPKRIYFVDHIPRNAAKKLLRRELRALIE